MPFKTHNITKYTYSITGSNNDYAAKIQLLKDDTTPGSWKEVGTIKFIYEGGVVPATEFSADLEQATIFMPEKKLNSIIDLLRNEKPIILTLNPPFAFLGTSIEQVGDNDKK